MSKGSKMELPGNLRGYKLKKVHNNFFMRIILWIIIILVILWFINKQIVLDLFYELRNFIASLM